VKHAAIEIELELLSEGDETTESVGGDRSNLQAEVASNIDATDPVISFEDRALHAMKTLWDILPAEFRDKTPDPVFSLWHGTLLYLNSTCETSFPCPLEYLDAGSSDWDIRQNKIFTRAAVDNMIPVEYHENEPRLKRGPGMARKDALVAERAINFLSSRSTDGKEYSLTEEQMARLESYKRQLEGNKSKAEQRQAKMQREATLDAATQADIQTEAVKKLKNKKERKQASKAKKAAGVEGKKSAAKGNKSKENASSKGEKKSKKKNNAALKKLLTTMSNTKMKGREWKDCALVIVNAEEQIKAMQDRLDVLKARIRTHADK
jgi:hypothetical protein